MIELLDRLRGHRRKEVDQIPVWFAKQQRAISPRHGRRPLDKIADPFFELLVLLIDIGNAKLDDRGMLSAGRAAPGPNISMVRLLPIASVQDGVANSAKSTVYHVADSPVTCS